MKNKTPQDTEKYLSRMAVQIVNDAANYDKLLIQERLNKLKDTLRIIYLDGCEDGFELGFESGVNQQLGL